MGDEANVASFVPSFEKDTASHLATQDLSQLKIDELTPLTPMIISRQATINIGIAPAREKEEESSLHENSVPLLTFFLLDCVPIQAQSVT
jgi:hypothetical protein